jgi:hypothetical protein
MDTMNVRADLKFPDSWDVVSVPETILALRSNNDTDGYRPNIIVKATEVADGPLNFTEMIADSRLLVDTYSKVQWLADEPFGDGKTHHLLAYSYVETDIDMHLLQTVIIRGQILNDAVIVSHAIGSSQLTDIDGMNELLKAMSTLVISAA